MSNSIPEAIQEALINAVQIDPNVFAIVFLLGGGVFYTSKNMSQLNSDVGNEESDQELFDLAKNDRGIPCVYHISEIDAKLVESILYPNQHNEEKDMKPESNSINETATQTPSFNYQFGLSCRFSDVPNLDALSSDELLDVIINELSSMRGNPELIRKVFSYRKIDNVEFVPEEPSENRDRLKKEVQELRNEVRRLSTEVTNLRLRQPSSPHYDPGFSRPGNFGSYGYATLYPRTNLPGENAPPPAYVKVLDFDYPDFNPNNCCQVINLTGGDIKIRNLVIRPNHPSQAMAGVPSIVLLPRYRDQPFLTPMEVQSRFGISMYGKIVMYVEEKQDGFRHEDSDIVSVRDFSELGIDKWKEVSLIANTPTGPREVSIKLVR